MSSYDWSQFDIHFYIEADADEVFHRWTCTHGLESFFIKAASFETNDGETRPPLQCCQPGDSYEWQWWHDKSTFGKVLELDCARKRLAFSFADFLVVSIDVVSLGELSHIHLRQNNIPKTEEAKVKLHLDCRGGWIYFLTCLKAALECGVDIREKNPHRALSLAIGFQP